ncbi:hypothetical protein FACS18942_00310 [Planctomycetales bacterium]|nr:hypothetical protein FACS18942_00310 [Planctomycetales bacterium]
MVLFALFRMWYERKRKRNTILPLVLFCLLSFSLDAKESPLQIESAENIAAFDWKPVWRETGD